MILFYIRHGDPVYDPDSLTPLGKRQAEAIAKRLARHGIDRIFASTSNRAIQTAQPTSELAKKEIQVLDFCNEGYAWRDFAVPNENGHDDWAFWNKMTMYKFASPEVCRLGTQWYEHPDFKEYKFKEGIERVNRETDAFLLSLGYEHIREKGIYKAVKPTNERVALFAHLGFGLSFLSSVLDIPYPQFCTHFDLEHSGMSVIEFRNIDGIVIPRALTVSSDSHIYKEGLPTHYNNTIPF